MFKQNVLTVCIELLGQGRIADKIISVDMRPKERDEFLNKNQFPIRELNITDESQIVGYSPNELCRIVQAQ